MSSRLDGRFPVIHSAFTLLLRQQSPVDHSRDATRELVRIASLVIHSDIVLCQRQQSAVDLAAQARLMQQPCITAETVMDCMITTDHGIAESVMDCMITTESRKR